MPSAPDFIFSEFAVSGVNPSGSRHLESPASGFVKQVNTLTDQFLDFGSVNNTESKQVTATKAILARIDSFNDANEAIFDLRFWLPDFSDFAKGTFFFNGFPSGQWIQDIALTEASGYYIPTSLPSGQNWWRDAGGSFDRDSLAFKEITGSGLDSQVTQWMYLSVTVQSDVPAKTYGGNGGGFTYRCTYSYR